MTYIIGTYLCNQGKEKLAHVLLGLLYLDEQSLGHLTSKTTLIGNYTLLLYLGY